MKSLNQWAEEIHEWAVRKGWWETQVYDANGHPLPRNMYELIALAHSELSEALEHLRSGNVAPDGTPVPLTGYWLDKKGKPDSWAIEMVDVIIRLLDTLASQHVDVDAMMEVKMAYNEKRPYRHGGKLA